MALETRLANELIRNHPARAATVLERVSAAETAQVLRRVPVTQAAALLGWLSPHQASDVLDALPDERVAELVEALPVDVASRLARRLREGRVDAVLAARPSRAARGIRALIRFPEHTAGALMDPDVLALPESFSAREALERVREAPERARYNVYVVDPEQKLVGVVNLRELFLAKPAARLSDLMVRNPIALPATADRSRVVSHPGWKEVHSLPVVDESGGYLGAVRYRTLRELEDLFFRRGLRDADAQMALGQLFSAGAGGLLDAITAPRARTEDA